MLAKNSILTVKMLNNTNDRQYIKAGTLLSKIDLLAAQYRPNVISQIFYEFHTFYDKKYVKNIMSKTAMLNKFDECGNYLLL